MSYGKENIGKNIKRFRIARNMTQEQLANKLNVNRLTVGRWENGSLEPRTNKLFEIAKQLGIDVSNLYWEDASVSYGVALIDLRNRIINLSSYIDESRNVFNSEDKVIIPYHDKILNISRSRIDDAVADVVKYYDYTMYKLFDDVEKEHTE